MKNDIIINLDMVKDSIFEADIEIDGVPFRLKLKDGLTINITMTNGFAARHNLRVQKGMFFLEGDFRSHQQSKIMKGNLNILGLEFNDTYFERFHEHPGQIYLGLDYFKEVNIDVINRKVTLKTTKEYFNEKLTERNSTYTENKDYDPDVFLFECGGIVYHKRPENVEEYIIRSFDEEKERWEKERKNPITNLELHEYAYEPMDYILKLSEEIFKCYMGEYGDDSEDFLGAYDWNYRFLKGRVSKEEMKKQYKEWKNSIIEYPWKPKITSNNLDDDFDVLDNLYDLISNEE